MTRSEQGSGNALLHERAFDALADLVAVKDRELRFLYANQAFQEFYGRRQGELAGAKEASVGQAAEAEAHEEQDRNVLSSGIFVDVPCELLTRHDGVRLPFHVLRCPLRGAAGEVVAIVVSARGVRDEAGAASARAERGRHHNLAMLSVIPDMYFRVGRDGTYLEFSAGRGLDTALPPSLFLGKRVQDVTPDLAPWVMECIDKALATGDVIRHEFKMFVQGHYLDYEARALAHGPDDVLFIVRDITVQKENERRAREVEVVKKLNEELERRVAERTAQLSIANRELEAFSYSVSHDLRTPLQVIARFSAALAKHHGSKLEPEAQEHLSRIRSASERMDALIEDLLGLSRIARAEVRRERVDLSGLVEGVLAELGRAEPERRVELAVAPGVTAEGDARLLRIALENLLGNAWKYTSKQPRARIEVGVIEHPGERAVYFVRDNGAGFDMNLAGKLFAPFHRLHHASEFPGTGVGLATVQRIVGRHGGRIWAESAVGHGATFYFTLQASASLAWESPS